LKRAALLALAACGRGAPIETCNDSLHGVYASGDERWMVLDRGATLEAYPLFPDVAGSDAAGPGETGPGAAGPGAAGPGALVVAPRAIELERGPAGVERSTAGLERSTAGLERSTAGLERSTAGLSGALRRRYMQGAAICEARVPVHVTRCAADTLELVLADPSPPLGFAPCTWPRPAPSRVVRWRRAR
jgi:hypothetical protein